MTGRRDADHADHLGLEAHITEAGELKVYEIGPGGRTLATVDLEAHYDGAELNTAAVRRAIAADLKLAGAKAWQIRTGTALAGAALGFPLDGPR